MRPSGPLRSVKEDRTVLGSHARTLGLALATSALVLVGCGGGSSGGSSGGSDETSPRSGSAPKATKNDQLAAMVPADVKADGTVVVGTDASYAPNEFFDPDGKTIVGMDVDLGSAVATTLGLRPRFVNSAFDGIIPGLAAGKYELGMSSFTVNPEREKQVDMVSYFTAGTSFATKTGNPQQAAVDDLCGKTVAVQRGTVQVDDLTARANKCRQEGKPTITMRQFQLQTDVTLAVISGRAVAMLADSPVVAYAVKQSNGQLEVIGASYDNAPYGIAVPKNKGQFTQAVQRAVQQLMDEGTYRAVLEKWGVEAGAIDKAEINLVKS
jgi:polar amino acid transport system substrate-binding protein